MIRSARRKRDCLDSLSRFAQINQDLAGLSGQKQQPPEDHNSSLQKLPHAYHTIRNYFVHLQNFFRGALRTTCSCDAAHCVQIRLQIVSDEGQCMDSRSLKLVVLLSFEMNRAMVARLPWGWKDPDTIAMETRPAISTQSQPLTPRTPNVEIPENLPAAVQERPKGILNRIFSETRKRKSTDRLL